MIQIEMCYIYIKLHIFWNKFWKEYSSENLYGQGNNFVKIFRSVSIVLIDYSSC